MNALAALLALAVACLGTLVAAPPALARLDGKRVVRTSFDPTLPPPAAPAPYGLGAPQFPGIAPGPPPGTPQPAGAAR